jgi:hypothetical protein
MLRIVDNIKMSGLSSGADVPGLGKRRANGHFGPHPDLRQTCPNGADRA